MRVNMSPHAKERAIERIPSRDLKKFVEGVAQGSNRIQSGDLPWALRVVWEGRVLGYAVGRGSLWQTTIGPGQTPDRTSMLFEVKVR